jgi:hypothetical protein
MAGLLFVPGIVQRRVRDAHPVDGNLRISRPWIAAGILCGVIFVAFIGPGIRL